MEPTTRPIDTMTVDPDSRVISGTGTYVDGAEHYGPAEFAAEHGCTYAEFMERMMAEPAPEGEPATFFSDIKARR